MKHEARKQKGIGLAQANPKVSSTLLYSTQRNASLASPSLVKQGFLFFHNAQTFYSTPTLSPLQSHGAPFFPVDRYQKETMDDPLHPVKGSSEVIDD